MKALKQQLRTSYRLLSALILLTPCFQAINASAETKYNSKNGAAKQPIKAAFQYAKAQPFLHDQQWLLHTRTYFMARNTDSEPDKKALATGGWLNWTSGYWRDTIQVRATAFTSQKVIGDKGKDGTQLLQPGQKSFSGISEVHIDLKLDNSQFRVGRFAVNTPYLNQSDTRMIPYTFEGIGFRHQVNDNWRLAAGHFTDIKSKDSTNFEPLYKHAGLSKNRGLSSAGILYNQGTHTGGIYMHHAQDFISTLYAEYNYKRVLATNNKIIFSGQYSHQQSSGAKLRGDINADHFGAKTRWFSGPFTSTIAHSYYSNTEQLLSPWGSYAGFTTMIFKDFNRPGERTWLAGLDVNFKNWGLPGFNVDTIFSDGNTPDSGTNASPDHTEWDITFNYRIQTGALKNMWFRLRNAKVNPKDNNGQHNAKDISDLRFIINHEWKL